MELSFKKTDKLMKAIYRTFTSLFKSSFGQQQQQLQITLQIANLTECLLGINFPYQFYALGMLPQIYR